VSHSHFLFRYEKLKGTTFGAHNSIIYNERALIFSLQTMLSLIKDPPVLFYDLVKQHFAFAKSEIIQLGTLLLTEDNNNNSNTNNQQVNTESKQRQNDTNETKLFKRFGIFSPSTISSGFKLALKSFFSELTKALEQCNCEK
jgi:hypothetical protein